MILLVVDTQKGIMDSRLFEFEKVSSNIKKLISTARQNNVEVIYVQHDDGPGSGFSKDDIDYEIYDDFKPETNEKVFCKSVNSAFHPSTGLADYLVQKNENQIIITGLQTDYCIDATVKSGFEHGFEVIIPAFTNSTMDNSYFSKDVAYHFYNDFMWPKRYTKCVTMEEAVKMIEINKG